MTGRVKLVTVGNQAEVRFDEPEPDQLPAESADTETEEEEAELISPFRAEIEAAVNARRQEVINAWKKWMAFWADFGTEVLVLEECPVLSHTDLPIVRQWCKDEGFEVTDPRWLSKVGTRVRLIKRIDGA